MDALGRCDVEQFQCDWSTTGCMVWHAADILMIQHPMEVKGTAAINGGGFSARGNLTLGGILRPRGSLWDLEGSDDFDG